MINNKKIAVVLPAYNAEKTVQITILEIPREYVDFIILVDDASTDNTSNIARTTGVDVHLHDENIGYGGNQKTCYKEALIKGADIVVMVHPDYQYTPKLIIAMASMIAYGVYDAVIGSRILGKTAISGGMPLYKYIANRFLTFFQNILMGQKLSEYHSGYRAFSSELLNKLNLERNSNDFAFDNQMITQIFYNGYSIGEVSCPTKYFKDASSINFKRSVQYGLHCILNSILYILAKKNIYISKILKN